LEGIVGVVVVAFSGAAVTGTVADVGIDSAESAGAVDEVTSTVARFEFEFEFESGFGTESEIESVAEEGAGAGAETETGAGSVTFWSRLSSLFTGDLGIAFGV
jgi:hypothetical protein